MVRLLPCLVFRYLIGIVKGKSHIILIKPLMDIKNTWYLARKWHWRISAASVKDYIALILQKMQLKLAYKLIYRTKKKKVKGVIWASYANWKRRAKKT